jgi:nicotinate-nucleotide adenylyltransferase
MKEATLCWTPYRVPAEKDRWIPLKKLVSIKTTDAALLCLALGAFYRCMPSGRPGFQDIPLPSFLAKNNFSHFADEIVFFGGTFDPWHKGHSACIKLCPHEHVLVIPDYNPFKKKIAASKNSWERVKNIAFKFARTSAAIYPAFAALEHPNPTVSWLLKTRISRKYLLLGDDNFMVLLKWKKAKELIRNIHKIFVVPRNHKKHEIEDNFKALLKINPLLEMELLPDHPYKNISSTTLRKRSK